MDYLINRIDIIVSCLEKIKLDLYFYFIKIKFQIDEMFKYKSVARDQERLIVSFFRVVLSQYNCKTRIHKKHKFMYVISLKKLSENKYNNVWIYCENCKL